ncbi:mannose-1-phosphate guanylyltransferase [Peribacillus frigoritolerans]|uniref:mannose-1-phosphate guanylyltransferase n=1 Tax=Peribacillus frigoritolerans TaxID=450367 RepID=UPI002417D1E6|nr:sugar phosphate nucleotidyltransferase [Peribacillus frigoritolerans]MDG4847529.1 sugar phosphate nucleotidyltransferase [Peribacillus frigoritolerans]
MKIVILAGGQGTRFWPWSVKNRPKQFLTLMSELTMLQQTYYRFRKWLPPEKIFIATTDEYVPLIKQQLNYVNNEQLIVEPIQRDTGPCIAFTAFKFIKDFDDEAFATVPADHYIPDDNSLPEIFTLAEKLAEREFAIVTLGIQPTRPETGYGYIQTETNGNQFNQALRVKAFIEKPCLEKAEKLLKTKNVYWNSGVFIWKSTTIAHYMKKFQSEIWNTLTRNKGNLSRHQYSILPKISVDCAILEKAENIYMIPFDSAWDDVGNWSAWERLNKKTTDDNLVLGDVHLLSTKNCIIKSEDRKALVIGVEDLIIASTKDGVLVCHKSQEQKIKDILKNISDGSEQSEKSEETN